MSATMSPGVKVDELNPYRNSPIKIVMTREEKISLSIESPCKS